MRTICPSVSCRAGSVVALLATLIPVSAGAKDLDLLTRLLIPGYVAQDFAAVCDKDDPNFLPEIDGGAATVTAYAQHLKIEITSKLTQADAMKTMIVAANTAMSVARKQVQALSDADSVSVSAAKIGTWCHSSAKPYILNTVRAHTAQHGAFDKMVADAKR